MDEYTERKFHAIRTLARGNNEYCRLLKENGELEKKYDDILSTLPPNQQDTIQDFLMSCEGLSWCMLEIACRIMRFPTGDEVIEQLRQEGASEEYIAACQDFFQKHPH